MCILRGRQRLNYIYHTRLDEAGTGAAARLGVAVRSACR